MHRRMRALVMLTGFLGLCLGCVGTRIRVEELPEELSHFGLGVGQRGDS